MGPEKPKGLVQSFKEREMILHDNSYRNRAANALHTLVGGAGKQCFLDGHTAIEMADIGLVLLAGDHERPLAPASLAPLATKTGYNVMATWVDPVLSGHRYLIDAVVMTAGVPQVFAEYRLFRTNAETSFLIDGRGDEPAIAIDVGGIRVAPRLPYRDTAGRMLGIAAGQALLQHRIFARTPYATALERNLAR